MNNSWSSTLSLLCDTSVISIGNQSSIKCLTNCLNSIFQNEQKMNHINDYIKYTERNIYSKSSSKSVTYRNKGNSLYIAKKLEEALFYFSKAIIFAESNSVELSLAYSNRSAVLYHQNEWKSCIDDIEIALSKSYPPKKMFKLYKRLAYCNYYLHNVEKVKEILSKFSIELENQELSEQDLDDLDLLKKKVLGSSNMFSSEMKPYTNSLPHLEQHLQIAFASHKIDLKINNGCRAIFSNSEIAPGEILFIEPAYVAVTLCKSDKNKFVCDKCCQLTQTPLPCNYCCDVVYCTDICQTSAWANFHNWECAGAQHRFWKQLGIAHLATRLLIQSLSGLSYILNFIDNVYNQQQKCYFDVVTLLERIDKVQSEKDCKNLMKESAPRYAFVLSLITNMHKLDKEDYLKYCWTAVLVTKYLKLKTKFFDFVVEKNPSIQISSDEWMILSSALLMQHICQLVCNGHSIIIMNEGLSVSNIATALYPAISIMNHSCKPNIVTSFSGSIQIVRALCAIKRGEEIFNCYGPNFRSMDFDERQSSLLEQYHFICRCSACSNSNYRDYYKTFNAYSCPKCSGPVNLTKAAKCINCGEVDMTKVLLNMKSNREQFLRKNFLDDNALNLRKKTSFLCKAYEQCLYKNNTELLEFYSCISNALADSGLFEDSVIYMQKDLSLLKSAYGENSLELAEKYVSYSSGILTKYLNYLKSNDMLRAQLFSEVQNDIKMYIQKALFIYTLYYNDIFYKREMLESFIKSIENL